MVTGGRIADMRDAFSTGAFGRPVASCRGSEIG
jgi:hypothetical protein